MNVFGVGARFCRTPFLSFCSRRLFASSMVRAVPHLGAQTPTMAIKPVSDEIAMEAAKPIHTPRDPNTLSNYNAWRTKHTAADFNVDFEGKRLTGIVHLTLESLASEKQIVLDTR